MAATAPDRVLLYLPNPAAREHYVDTHHPGRRDAFFASLDALATTLGLPLVNLSGRLDAARFYEDFHHLAARGVPAVTQIIATELERRLGLRLRAARDRIRHRADRPASPR